MTEDKVRELAGWCRDDIKNAMAVIRTVWREAAADEREACARACDEAASAMRMNRTGEQATEGAQQATALASTIRARATGETP